MISVIIPVYNAAPYLPEMLQSLLVQTECNLEILLIDDGSTDSSADICKVAAQKDARIRYIFQQNAGVSAARNRALALAKGEYIAFLDADDRIDPDYFELLFLACRNADISVCNVSVETRAGEQLTVFSAGDQCLSVLDATNLLLTRKSINSGPCGKLFRRETLVNLEFPPLKVYEDILFVRDAFARAEKIVSTSKAAYHYYQNAESTMARQKKEPSHDIILATDSLLGYIVQRPELSPMCFYITVSHLYQYVLELDSNALSGQRFMRSVRQLYRKYWAGIVCCRAFPWKEKILYLLFALGLRQLPGER